MFVRQKKNPSGVISVQVIEKSKGFYRMLKTIGSSADASEVKRLVQLGHEWIREKHGQRELNFGDERSQALSYLQNIQQIAVAGHELLLGKIFDEIGFNAIEDEIFRKLVLARICFPASKLKTTHYLSAYEFIEMDVQQVYRYMDKLYLRHKEDVQLISFRHTQRILGGNLSVVFYDVTTLYFEIDHEDDLRKTGFSKEGKHQNPQIVLGLLVGRDGYPLAYEIFKGNKFEGHTMLPVIDRFKERFKLQKLIIIADSGLLSKENVKELKEKNYEFILGARLKNEVEIVKKKVLSASLSNGESKIIEKEDLKLVISYSDRRAKKDRLNRERGLERLKKKVQSGKLTKANINNRGYNKYLKLDGEINITIDEEKFKEDGKWDGLKGYLTNTQLCKEDIINNYNELWKIEKAFRVSKTDLKIRPIYHRLSKRIEAHICLSFTAYKVYKELERQLQVKQADISVVKAIETAKTIYRVKMTTPTTGETVSQILLLNEEQKSLANLFGF